MAFPSTLILPMLIGSISASGSPIGSSVVLHSGGPLAFAKVNQAVGGIAEYTYGNTGIKPNRVTVRKGKIAKFGLATLTTKALLVPDWSEQYGASSHDPKKGHAVVEVSCKIPEAWPEHLLEQLATAVALAIVDASRVDTNAKIESEADKAANLLRAASAGEV